MDSLNARCGQGQIQEHHPGVTWVTRAQWLLAFPELAAEGRHSIVGWGHLKAPSSIGPLAPSYHRMPKVAPKCLVWFLLGVLDPFPMDMRGWSAL